MKLQLSPALLNQIERHGESSYPREGAGVLLGTVNEDHVNVEDLMIMPNTFEQQHQHRRYQIDAHGMMQAELTAERQGLDVVGIFHSHPDHPARPSTYDLEHSLPWYAYIITSVQGGQALESLAWRLNEDRGSFTEIEIHAKENL